MRFTATIELEPAAFDPDYREELARILSAIVAKVTCVPYPELATGAWLRDVNGNTIGRWDVE